MKKDSISFIYTTDLHGQVNKYQDVLEFALRNKVKLIHLGADLLPKGSGILKNQKNFVEIYLKDFYAECEHFGIKVLAFFGNDDIYSCKKYFRKYATLLDEVSYKTSGFEFKAYPYILDYPFGLKSACKWDYDGWRCPEAYLTNPCEFNDSDYYLIGDIEAYFIQKGTIEEDLRDLHADRKTIMAMHMPPSALGMDVCYGNKRVGSRSVLDWILREKPLLFLCGHIHESPEISNIWKTEIEKTMVIQPGQKTDRTTMVYIRIENNKIETHLIG